MNSILKNMARISLFLAISVGAMANLDEGRWVPKNREVLDKVISEEKVKPKYEEVTKYPEITRDIAMLVDLEDEYQNIYNAIESVNSKLITNVELFDLYVGLELVAGKKSLALTITYSDKEKTLTDEEVTAVHEKVLAALTEYGAIIR